MKLFISYASDDKHWVYELWRQLLNEGHQPWIDRDIPVSADWWRTICKEIERSECFIYVMTPKSVESIYCLGEMEFAIALNKPILPLMLKPCDLPKALSDRRIQYQQISDDMNIDRVLLKIEKGIGEIRYKLGQGEYEPQTVPYPDVPIPHGNLASDIKYTHRKTSTSAAGDPKFDRFTSSAQDVAARAYEISVRYSHSQVDTEHIFLALLEQPENVTSQLLKKINVPVEPFRNKLNELLESKHSPMVVDGGVGQVFITKRVKYLIDRSNDEANRLKDQRISDEHIFLALILLHDDSTEKVLRHAGISHDELINQIERVL